MLAILFAVSTAAVPAADRAALSPCAPARHTACHRTEGKAVAADIRAGKRCHPDPSKSASCREVFVEREARSKEALADAR